MVYILPQKAFGGEFIHVISYAENFNFTTYSINEVSVQIRFNRRRPKVLIYTRTRLKILEQKVTVPTKKILDQNLTT